MSHDLFIGMVVVTSCVAVVVGIALWFESRLNLRRAIHERDCTIKSLCELISHCWVHSGHQDCGSSKMSSDMRDLYEAVIGRIRCGECGAETFRDDECDT